VQEARELQLLVEKVVYLYPKRYVCPHGMYSRLLLVILVPWTMPWQYPLEEKRLPRRHDLLRDT
jgi:hypothetical protein